MKVILIQVKCFIILQRYCKIPIFGNLITEKFLDGLKINTKHMIYVYIENHGKGTLVMISLNHYKRLFKYEKQV
ncbi:MAG TPA: hypothetical protein DDZ04_08145 [Parabacteroides sp.]|nr:hypothetical protein [Parabacteroides sp.]